jgi:hypothetical protein
VFDFGMGFDPQHPVREYALFIVLIYKSKYVSAARFQRDGGPRLSGSFDYLFFIKS